MNKEVKGLFEKMIDYKRFATVLLAFGVFFFLGVVIPIDVKTSMEVNLMIIGCSAFLAGSVFFYTISKQCEMKLLDMEEDPENINRK